MVLNLLPLLLPHGAPSLKEPLADVLPVRVEGWQCQTLPIADTIEMQKTVERILQFDDAICRVYQKPGVQVQVYVAYWRPGSAPYGQAGAHTPDTCWVNNGWLCQDRMHLQHHAVGGWSLTPFEYGKFTQGGQALDVIFWHLVGGKPYGYEQSGWRDGLAGYVERAPRLLQDLRTFGLNLAQAQFVIRISTNVSFAGLWQDPAFVRLMHSLGPIGIFERPESGRTRGQGSDLGPSP